MSILKAVLELKDKRGIEFNLFLVEQIMTSLQDVFMLPSNSNYYHLVESKLDEHCIALIKQV